MNLLKSISLHQLWQHAASTFLKYPLVLLSALLGTGMAWWRIGLNYEQQQLYAYLEKLLLVSALGLILFFVLELLARNYRLSGVKRVLLLAAGVIFLVVYFLLLPAFVENRQILRFLLLWVALHLIASYVLFLNLRTQNAFWQFNRVLFLRILTGALYSAVLFIGLAIAITALRHLFSLDIREVTYGRLWLFLVGVFNTWFFLAGVPEQVQELEQEQHYPRGLKVFTQFVLLPLVALYLVILYVYFGKIVVQWEWPEGWVSVLVLCFSIAGILSLLLIHPIRNDAGNTWMRTFARWFYRALFPLIILLLLAIWRRVSEYGVTEERYVVLALALWLCCTAVYFLVSSQKNIKFIPVTLSILALLGAFGPFNVFQVSAWSQKNRLERLLQQYDILQDGKLVAASGKVPESAGVEISSIVRYMSEMQHLHRLQPWFKQDIDSIASAVSGTAHYRWLRTDNQTEAVLKIMGVPYTGRHGGGELVRHHDIMLKDKGRPRSIIGYDYAITNCHLYEYPSDEEQQEYMLNGISLQIRLNKSRAMLEFQYKDEMLQVGLKSFIQEALKHQASGRLQLTTGSMTKAVSGKQIDLKVLIDNISIAHKGDKSEVIGVFCTILVMQKD